MPDANFDNPEIDKAFLPCHDSSFPEHADITTQVSDYFGEAMGMFIELKKAGELGSTSIVAHRAFVGCISHHRDTKTVSCSDVRHPDARAQEFYFDQADAQKRIIPYTSLVVERDGSIPSGPPMYYIKFHHEQDLPIGYFDDETHTYHAIGNDEFQAHGRMLLRKMLQTGFVSFLEGHSESLTSEQVRALLSRNIPRLGDAMIADLQQALAQIKQ